MVGFLLQNSKLGLVWPSCFWNKSENISQMVGLDGDESHGTKAKINNKKDIQANASYM